MTGNSPPSRNLPNPNAAASPGGRLAVWLATGFGLGNAPKASGTFGTMLGIPLAIGIAAIPGTLAQAAVIAGVFLAAVAITHVALPRINRGKDPGCVVIDEIVTLPVTFFLIPPTSVPLVVAGFVLHRVFDIAKPPPARQLEHLPGAWGVMSDDLAAAIYSNLALHLLVFLLPGLR